MRPFQAILDLEAVVDTLPRSLTRNGTRLTDRDAETVKDVYQQWTLLLLDLGYLTHEHFALEARRLLEPMAREDVLQLLQKFADCLQEVYNSRLGSYNRGFKALCKGISPRLYTLLQPDVILASHGDLYAMRRLVQVFAFPTRLSLQDLDLEFECLVDYKATETNMDTSYPQSYILALNKIIRRWFKHIDFNDLDFSHGPGGVAGLGRTSLENKYYNLSQDVLTKYAFPQYEPPRFKYESIESEPFRPLVEMTRISSTIFVPKSYKTFRTISMEPPTLMFLQQGIWGRIDEYVNRYKYLRDRIGFHDQKRNQELAKIGSLKRNFATIDLSAASDSVSWELVKRVFRGTKILRYLYACRSTHTMLPDGTYMSLKKFAPMGSALCFPIETIIFAAICEFVTHEHDFSGSYSVFGDDIIVPTECTQDVFYVLERLGFTPNQSKSFFDERCAFRESCGGEFFNGFDVTPLRISRKYNSEGTDIGCIGIAEMMNSCHQRNFRYLRAFLWKKLDEAILFAPLFSPSSILGDNYTNYHLRRRWNIKLQRMEVRSSALTVKYELRSDEVAYYDWLLRKNARSARPRRTLLDRIVEDYGNIIHFYKPISPNETGEPVVKSRRRWIAAPYSLGNEQYIQEQWERYNLCSVARSLEAAFASATR